MDKGCKLNDKSKGWENFSQTRYFLISVLFYTSTVLYDKPGYETSHETFTICKTNSRKKLIQFKTERKLGCHKWGLGQIEDVVL